MKKHLINEQRSRDAAAKKELYNTSRVGKSNNYYEHLYTSLQQLATPIFHPLSTIAIHTLGVASGWNVWAWLSGGKCG